MHWRTEKNHTLTHSFKCITAKSSYWKWSFFNQWFYSNEAKYEIFIRFTIAICTGKQGIRNDVNTSCCVLSWFSSTSWLRRIVYKSALNYTDIVTHVCTKLKTQRNTFSCCWCKNWIWYFYAFTLFVVISSHVVTY